jgi:hypothetical protein
MPHKKLSRNIPCPCGSGKVYGACCWGKGFEWVEDEAGTVLRSTPMSPEVREAGLLVGGVRELLGRDVRLTEGLREPALTSHVLNPDPLRVPPRP